MSIIDRIQTWLDARDIAIDSKTRRIRELREKLWEKTRDYERLARELAEKSDERLRERLETAVAQVDALRQRLDGGESVEDDTWHALDEANARCDNGWGPVERVRALGAERDRTERELSDLCEQVREVCAPKLTKKWLPIQAAAAVVQLGNDFIDMQNERDALRREREAAEEQAHAAEANLRTEEPADAQRETYRDKLAPFVEAMVDKLVENTHKGDEWKDDYPENLAARVEEEARELIAAVDKYAASFSGGIVARGDVLAEAADVANMAMMVADACDALHKSSPGPDPAEEAQRQLRELRHVLNDAGMLRRGMTAAQVGRTLSERAEVEALDRCRKRLNAWKTLVKRERAANGGVVSLNDMFADAHEAAHVAIDEAGYARTSPTLHDDSEDTLSLTSRVRNVLHDLEEAREAIDRERTWDAPMCGAHHKLWKSDPDYCVACVEAGEAPGAKANNKALTRLRAALGCDEDASVNEMVDAIEWVKRQVSDLAEATKARDEAIEKWGAEDRRVGALERWIENATGLPCDRAVKEVETICGAHVVAASEADAKALRIWQRSANYDRNRELASAARRATITSKPPRYDELLQAAKAWRDTLPATHWIRSAEAHLVVALDSIEREEQSDGKT